MRHQKIAKQKMNADVQFKHLNGNLCQILC